MAEGGGGAGEIEGGQGKIFSIKRGNGKCLDQKSRGIKKILLLFQNTTVLFRNITTLSQLSVDTVVNKKP